ncbi:MAG: exodeoxyribonuclease VII large subunit [Pseudomonadota bacterium]
MITNTSNVAEYTVSEVSQAVKCSIEDTFSFVRVRGELGRVSRPGSGHIYLDLKDDRAVLSGVIWKGNAARMQIEPEQGLEVIATGRLTTFPGQSRYQIVIETLEPAGLGALMALLEERKKKLAAEGLFDPDRKQLIPYLPRVIGVVTSPTGAVISDIMHRLNDRFPTHVLVWPVRVQGDQSADEVTAAIRGFNALDPDGDIPRPDLLIVARGGGSLEDLWSFNEERVVRAAAESDIPLISAIGHETDWTLLDFVADERAPTPTAAAERAVPVRADLIAALNDNGARLRTSAFRLIETRRAALRSAERGLPRLQDLVALPRQALDYASASLLRALSAGVTRRRMTFNASRDRLGPQVLRMPIQTRRSALSVAIERLGNGLSGRARLAKDRLLESGNRLKLASPASKLRLSGSSLQAVSSRLHPAISNRMKRQEQLLQSRAALLDAYSHQGVLQRGFALVRDRDGKLVRTVGAAKTAETVSLTFSDGTVDAVTGKAEAPRAKRARKATKQGSLFEET